MIDTTMGPKARKDRRLGKGNLLFLHDMDLRNRLPWAQRQGLRGDEIKGFVAILTRDDLSATSILLQLTTMSAIQLHGRPPFTVREIESSHPLPRIN